VPNPTYWGTKPLLAGTTFKFYSSQQPMILALEGNDVDVISLFVPYGATSLLNNTSYRIIKLTASSEIASNYGQVIAGYWWEVLFDALAIASLIVAVNLIGDAIERVLEG